MITFTPVDSSYTESQTNHLLVNIDCPICRSKFDVVLIEELTNRSFKMKCKKCDLEFKIKLDVTSNLYESFNDTIRFGWCYITLNDIYFQIYKPEEVVTKDDPEHAEKLVRYQVEQRSIAFKMMRKLIELVKDLDLNKYNNIKSGFYEKEDELKNLLFVFDIKDIISIRFDENGNFHSVLYQNELVKLDDLRRIKSYEKISKLSRSELLEISKLDEDGKILSYLENK